MESNILDRVENTAQTQRPPDSDSRTVPSDRISRGTRQDTWVNGDVIMTWNALQDPIKQCGLQGTWQPFKHDIDPNAGDGTPVAPALSPSIQTECSLTDTAFRGPDSTPRSTRCSSGSLSAFNSERVTNLIENYVVHIHSKIPILDLDLLKCLQDRLLVQNSGYDGSFPSGLLAGIEVPDMTILLLVLALGEVSSLTLPGKLHVPRSEYVDLAMPWFGAMQMDHSNAVKSLKAQVLLAIHCMWRLRPWDAYCHSDAAACAAEKLLLK